MNTTKTATDDAQTITEALTIDSGWREVADKSLAFIKRFV